jgi:hypothetical protein
MPNNIEEILDYNYIDNDFIYIADSKYVITSGACLSETLGQIVKKRGGVLLN